MGEYRKLFFKSLLTVLLCLLNFSAAFADVTLYRGANSLGTVISFEEGSNILVPIEDTGMLLGFSFSRSQEELLLRRGKENLRVVLNSAAAWRGFNIIPLYSAPIERSGKFWIDTLSAASLFQFSFGSESSNRLRFVKSSRIASARPDFSSSISELDFGKIDEDSTNKAAPKIPEITIPNTQPKTAEIQEIKLPEVKEVNFPEVKQETNPAPEIPKVTQNNQTKTANINVKKAPPKKQPRMETFNPGDEKQIKNASYSGNLIAVRWSSINSGTHKKIRAVVDVDENAEPQVEMVSPTEIQAFFLSSSPKVDGINSPYENVKSEIKISNGIVLSFNVRSFMKIEKLTLSSPKRIVFDFFFPPEVAILNSSNAVTPTVPTVAKTPTVPQITIPQTPAAPLTSNPPKTTQKPDPIININLPQTTTGKPIYSGTPPSQITIPITPSTPSNIPQNTSRRKTGRKLVVVDPGHGGKDPGTSANGVIEKTINLNVGLLLERELKSRGFDVIMTRRTDVYLKLQERTDIANNADADLFISVHVNALPARKATSGFEIYIMALPTDKDALNLAKVENREYVEGKGVDVANVDRRTEMLLRILGDMQQNNKISESTDFAAALFQAGRREGLPMKRVAQAPFFVIRGSGMPAVLLETGFCTNANEARLLLDPNYQLKIARAMANGAANYLR